MRILKSFNESSVKLLKYGIFLVLGLLLGRIFFHSREVRETLHDHQTEVEQATVWTCSMHPQIRMDHPGKCPICGMDLIPLLKGGSLHTDPDAIHLSKEAAELANVLTTKVSWQKPVRQIRLYGKVQIDERLFQSQVAHVPGRIEKLLVNFTGEQVRKGQKLAEIYSPELVNARQELIETAATRKLYPEFYEAAREKLRKWKLTDEQIEALENSGPATDNFDVLSNTSGTVRARRVSTGDYVSQGTVLFDIADLSRVWVEFDAYETDLPFIRRGDKVDFTVRAIPGSVFSGNIVFIDPVIDPVTRVAKVRVEAANVSGKLKPEMYATGTVSSDLKEYSNNLVIPGSAVLWTGKRSIVYVKDPGEEEPVFRMRVIELGPALGDSYIVTDGLKEGEEIVTRGTFSVDAAAQLEGKPSMMNPPDNAAAMLVYGMGAGKPGPDNTETLSDRKLKDDAKDAPAKINVSSDFKKQLTSVLDRYLSLKNSLVESDPEKVKQEAEKLKQAFLKSDLKPLPENDRLQWNTLSDKLLRNVTELIASDGLMNQRLAFQKLSNNLYIAIKTYGLAGKTLYYQFCPMFNNNNGGYWLSETGEIRNPYFGEEMLSCGETRENLDF